jgi:1-deoxy-D-xylulose-5-phosphate synthase
MNEIELRNIMYTAQLGLDFPIAIRYPRGRGTITNWQQPFKQLEIGKGKTIKEGSRIAVLSIGTIGNTIVEVCRELSDKEALAHYNMRFIKPLDADLLHTIFQKFDKIITIEDGTIVGGFGSAVPEFVQEHHYKNKLIKRLGIPDKFIEHGTVSELQEQLKLDKSSIKKFIEELFI